MHTWYMRMFGVLALLKSTLLAGLDYHWVPDPSPLGNVSDGDWFLCARTPLVPYLLAREPAPRNVSEQYHQRKMNYVPRFGAGFYSRK